MHIKNKPVLRGHCMESNFYSYLTSMYIKFRCAYYDYSHPLLNHPIPQKTSMECYISFNVRTVINRRPNYKIGKLLLKCKQALQRGE